MIYLDEQEYAMTIVFICMTFAFACVFVSYFGGNK